MRHSLGRVVATAAITEAVSEAVIIGLLDRHAARDWGDLDAEDNAANDADHSHAEGWLFSSYDTEDHGTIWVITEDLRDKDLNGQKCGISINYIDVTSLGCWRCNQPGRRSTH